MKQERNNSVIRAWQASDYKSLARYADNINVWNNVRDYFPHPYTEDDAKSYIDFVFSQPFMQNMAIVAGNEAAGGIGYIPQTDVERFNAEIGYWIGEPFWGKGIVTEAVAEFTNYIFSNTDIIRLFATVYEHNKGSMRVLEKNGFKKTGVFTNAAVKNGNFINLHYYELLKSQ